MHLRFARDSDCGRRYHGFRPLPWSLRARALAAAAHRILHEADEAYEAARARLGRPGVVDLLEAGRAMRKADQLLNAMVSRVFLSNDSFAVPSSSCRRNTESPPHTWARGGIPIG